MLHVKLQSDFGEKSTGTKSADFKLSTDMKKGDEAVHMQMYHNGRYLHAWAQVDVEERSLSE